MHPNRAFRQIAAPDNLSFARERGFGVLNLAGPDGLLASHLPFFVNDQGTRLIAHIVRSNPIHLALKTASAKGLEALMVVSGPDAYISPDWYGIDDQVPTWNYVAVHLRGRLRLGAPESLNACLEVLSETFERRLPDKPVWTMDKLTRETYEKLSRMILPIEMDIEAVDGTWKLSQNKPDAAREGVVSGLASSSVGVEIDGVRRLMTEAGGSDA